MVHFVHSWSAAAPGDVQTVAGRWLQRGAYLYAGSVHEPYLQAFVPTPKFAVRMTAGLPFAAAARLDSGDPWKVSILGDPLATLSKPGPTVARDLPLDSAVDVEAELAEATKARDFTRVFADLLLLGRDADSAELLDAMLRESREQLTPDAAIAALPCAFLTGNTEALIGGYRVAESKLAAERKLDNGALLDVFDMLWHALWPKLTTLGREKAQLLGMNMRPETLARDAGEAYSAVTAAINKEAAHEVITRAMRTATTDAQRKQIDQIPK